MGNENSGFFKGFSRLLIYSGIIFAFFFFFAIVIFSIRTGESEEMVMGDLMGKYYVDVHNELARSNLRIQIVKKNFPDRQAGLIMHQSIPAGATYHSRDKLTLVVNQSEPFLPMPALIGTSLSSAKATLSRIPSGDEIYALEVAAVSYIPLDEVPVDTVISQFPPAGEELSVKDKVYLLVAATSRDKSEMKVEELIGQNINMAQELLSIRGKDARIKTVEDQKSGIPTGRVLSAKIENNIVYLDVSYQKPKYRYFSGFEKIDVKLDKGECRAEQIIKKDEEPKLIYKSATHQDNEKVTIFLYRTGKNTVRVICGKDEIYDKTFSPDDLG